MVTILAILQSHITKGPRTSRTYAVIKFDFGTKGELEKIIKN